MSTDWMWVYENPKEAATEIDRLRGEVVFGFYEDLIPTFHQGYNGINELCEPVTAEEVTGYVTKIHELQNTERFFLAQDDSCHWYLVPASRKVEWEAWRDLPGTDERSWTVPDFTKGIDGPHRLTFTNPE